MTVPAPTPEIKIGVLALQGAFSEHIQLLRRASTSLPFSAFTFHEIRTPVELTHCDALIIPGGESTAISLVAARSGLLEPLREFVKVQRKPTWGTCAGLILLSESANRTKKGGQELIGGLDVRVNRNHFGRQTESFQAALRLPFLGDVDQDPFRCVFIRAPVVEKILPHEEGVQVAGEDTVVAPSKAPAEGVASGEVAGAVEVMARLPGKTQTPEQDGGEGNVIAVRQGNVFGCSFHPELTEDARIHAWWLDEVRRAVERRREFVIADRTE
ncbi:glutamine amidotransferas-like protein subunit pdxT [Dothidotthia symphoricarpi CBS 119687]|uniref:glutaminase n=1 Tax=Dothidotthia symphoricarpi CBS 119687 TaxID=1392245 RepID=A0A6A5ZZI8_9PLEO|nr:glutamine amidotransferas-like protein subunit pdxT [Dothidotthia symphoricarpi CBS 119687]KAF2124303.1 glutamine amidotransferas-like protein subunit pdxT [Dothidotthia symphoricarpi CBS 119687]